MADDAVTPLPEIVTRAEARAAGLKYYFTGEPCKWGHIAIRSVSSGCVPCCREKTKIRNRESYRTNPEFRKKSAEYNRRAQEKIRSDPEALEKERIRKRESARKARKQDPDFLAKQAAAMREYRKSPKVKEKIKSYKKKHYWANPDYRERAKAGTRRWHQDAKTNAAWVEKERARGRERVKNDPVGNRARRHRYRAKLKGNGGAHSAKDIARILDRQKHKCVYCPADLTKAYHIDHIMPLALGGSNWPKNLQALCPPCNLSKGAKHPIDFAKEKGRLL